MTDNAKIDDIEIASHKLCAALHMDGINPEDIEIHLPHEAWWRMWTRIEQKYRNPYSFDGRGFKPVKFQFMGIVYRVKQP